MKRENAILLLLLFWALISGGFLYTTLVRYVQAAEASHGMEYELIGLELKEKGNQGELTVRLKCINPSSVVLRTFQIRYLLYVNGRFIKSDALYHTQTLPPGETVVQFSGDIHQYPMEYVYEAREFGKMIWMMELEIVLELPFKGLRLNTSTVEYWVME
ncbi:MAG: hypothetical protein HXS41_11465 [Theionarchaea archaeon]|nr:hypothetical protein [Theionarchaea archaeon]MBU7000036.1 hypothetical protein [Theionarchaea archaeon]MBU7021666.1 hypothetical protein [Theionarchaea archaeon]MBU7034687.1 hypothetical protein [Theionarchaea archaeon]MBU7039347.1 hypothetical protein [Theionarchaea archaeon]